MYNYKYLIDYKYEGNIFNDPATLWPKTNPAIHKLKTSKEEKNMHKKRKYNGHNVHEGHTIFPMTGKMWSATFMYVVCPEEAVVIGWYEAPPNPETGENNGLLGRLTEWRLGICAPMLGKPGYLQAELQVLQKKCRERLNFQLRHSKVDNLKLFNVNKEEKKMHKKPRVNGHVAHRLPKCPGLYYTVEPENSCIAVYRLKYDELNDGLCYAEFEDITIQTRQLGRHGYLQEQIELIARRHSDLTSIRNYLKHEKMLNYDTFAGCLSCIKEDLKALNNTVFEEEKRMTEYYVIDVEMTFADRVTTAHTALQIRQSGNYFEIPFDAPDCTESKLESLEKCLRDYILETKKQFRVLHEKSEICSNSVLKIMAPYGDVSDDENREELCKMLTYAVEHKEYPYPPTDRDLGRLREVAFYLRECDKYEIYSKWYPAGIEGFIKIKGRVVPRQFAPSMDYIMDPTDVVSLTFNNGWLTHYELADGTYHRLSLANWPIALYDIARHKKPFQSLTEVETLLREIHAKREMWKNASYLTFEHTTDREKI